MIFSRKMNIKLTTIMLIFMIVFLTANVKLMEYGLQKSIEYTCEAQYKEILSQLESSIGLLEITTQKIAKNEKIINLLNSNMNFEDLDKNERILMNKQINVFEGVLETLTFIDTINIVSIQGNYLFSKGNTYENFDIKNRPWFKDEYLTMKDESILTSIHKDFSTGKYAIGIIALIYSEDNSTVLGAAILDIFIEDLLRFIDSGFYLGELDTYIKFQDNYYFSKDGMVSNLENYNKKNTFILQDKLDNGSDIVFAFNKDSIMYKQKMDQVNDLKIIILIIAGIIFTLILIRVIKIAFKPVMKSLDKLKVLVDNLEKNDFDFETDDEFKQLEFISNSLSKSFDKKIQSLIYYDDLTKIPNRKKLICICNELIEKEQKFALIFIDLNNFKNVNDVFGHVSGDELLLNFSIRMKEVIGEKGILTRYSGDEFIIVYDKYIDDEELKNFYRDVILKEFIKPIIFNNNKTIINFSAGVSVYPRDGAKFDELIKKSDFMMYSSKRNFEENNLLFFSDEVYNKIIRVENIKSELKKAVEKNEFVLYYQPIVNKDKVIKKVEALIRWQNPNLGFVSPIDFISYAEETGEIVNIGYWIIEEVCKNFNEFLSNGELVQVSINVSPIQLMEFDFVDKVQEILNKYNVDIKSLCFEITESVVLDGNIIVYDNVYLLYKIGANIALDDFGTGYASFSYLKKFRLNILKLDKIFIDNSREIDFKIVKNVKDIAHLLDMKIVVEGVETERQFNMLSEIGCDYFQGYYFSRPVTLESLKELMNT